MKKKSTSNSAFFHLRVLIACVLCLAGVAVALLAMGAFSSVFAQPRGAKNNQSLTKQDTPGTQTPDVLHVVGPVRLNQNLRQLPYAPKEAETEERRLTRYKFPGEGPLPSAPETSLPRVRSLLKGLSQPVPSMPPPLLTFEGGAAAQFCACAPPDTNGDVGPNHYVEAINNAFAVFDKNGNSLAGPITYDALFAPLGAGTPCGEGENNGDPFVLYDHVADRWLISDFAFPGGIPGSGPFWQCIAVSQTADPVAGGWFLYAVQHEPAHPTWVGDYPKFAMWNNPQPGGAYHFTVNLFDGPTLAFEGVRTFAMDRAAMLAGTSNPTVVAFTIGLAGVGDAYSLVAANFRTGNPPPPARDEMLLAVDATIPGATLTEVHGWLFHVDFVTPANSTIGLGADHTPNTEITVNPFVQAWTAQTYRLVPQQGTADKLDTLGDKIMTPLVYQNRNGTESLWANQTTMLNFPNGPTAVSWYQFDVTGGTFPATPLQQQEFTNGNDGLFRWMGSIAVDQNGNTTVGYSVSSANMFPSIRYAARLSSDPANVLGQGEANMFSGTGSQIGTNGRWGNYSMNTVDPVDGITFFHANEYYANDGSFDWHTRIGKFQFSGGTPTPTPTASPTAAPRSTPSPRPRSTPPPRP